MSPPLPPDDSVRVRKAALRAELRLRLGQLTPDQRQRDSAALGARLDAAREWTGARAILGFVALPSEPDLAEALAAAAARGSTVALPRWDPAAGEYRPALRPIAEDLVPGPYGVPEPPPASPWLDFERLDLVLVPGLAFDRRGRRLGRGRGHFDRLLARASSARRWGVAFDVQIVAEVPAEPHDINVHVLVTPGLWMPVVPPAPAGMA